MEISFLFGGGGPTITVNLDNTIEQIENILLEHDYDPNIHCMCYQGDFLFTKNLTLQHVGVGSTQNEYLPTIHIYSKPKADHNNLSTI